MSKKESYAEARRRIFGESDSTYQPEPSYPRRLPNVLDIPDDGELGEPANPRGVKLSLDEVPYDREMKWINEAAGQKPRRNMSKSSPFFRQMAAIAQDNSEYSQVMNRLLRSLQASCTTLILLPPALFLSLFLSAARQPLQAAGST